VNPYFLTFASSSKAANRSSMSPTSRVWRATWVNDARVRLRGMLFSIANVSKMLCDGTGAQICRCSNNEMGGLQRGESQKGRRGEVIMEQTLLPDGGSSPEINLEIDSKSHNICLTSGVHRVMYMIVNLKEVDNVNRKSKSNQRDETHGPVPQTDLLLRSRGGCRRETALSSGGWPGIQEPLGGRNGNHRAFSKIIGCEIDLLPKESKSHIFLTKNLGKLQK